MLGILASSASASSHKAFHLKKTCSSDVLCTVVSSSFKGIPAGTNITYVNGLNGLAYPTITIRNGSSTGVCDWNQPAGQPVLAKCTFGSGTGRLSQFHLAVNVTFDGSTYWFWDGTYWFGRGDRQGDESSGDENSSD
jgi:hypothetical protein